jgi:hypothetical protein
LAWREKKIGQANRMEIKINPEIPEKLVMTD